MGLLASKSPRVKVFSIGTTEEGREMIAVAVASESLIAGLEANRAKLAQLADPRTIAVDESPYVRTIRDNVVTLITPIVEVDGRDRQVDVFNWHMKHPGETYPSLIYW